MLEIIGGAIIGIFILSILISGFFMWLGAKMAGIKKSTFGRAILAAIAASLITYIVSAVFSVLPVIGTILGFFIGLLLSLFAIKSVFNTTFGRAFLAWIFNIVAQILAVIIGAALFVGGISTIIKGQ